jgi:hypothetical protein
MAKVLQTHLCVMEATGESFGGGGGREQQSLDRSLH